MVLENNVFFIPEHDYIGPQDFCDSTLKVLAFSAKKFQKLSETANNFSS